MKDSSNNSEKIHDLDEKTLELEMRTLIDIGIKLSTARSSEKVVEFVVYNMMGLFGLSSIALYEYVAPTGSMNCLDFKGFKMGQEMKKIKLEDHPELENELREKTGVFRAPQENLPEVFDLIPYIQPLKYKNKLVGMLLIGEKAGGREFRKDEKRLLALFSPQIASALENTRLYERLQRKNKILQETQQQLIQSTKMAAVGELAAGVAHEINNPLQSLIGYTRLINKKADSDKVKKYAGTMCEQIERCKRIVRDLLSYSQKRSEEGFKKINLKETLEKCYEAVRLQNHDDTGKIVDEIPGEPFYTEGDRDQIYQVFFNLLLNALQAVDGAGRITLRVFPGAKEHKISVIDDGPGISRENVSRIFDPFFTTKDEGTGLGLSIVYNIIEAHSGEINYFRRNDKTVFEVTLKSVENSEQ